LELERGSPPVTAESIERSYGGALAASRAYLRDMGAVERLADDMLRVEPDRIRILNRTELEAYGIGERNADGDAQKRAIELETLNGRSAQAYGLNRAEYIRRQAMAEKTCKLGSYTAPGDGPDFSIYGEPVDGPRETPAEWLARSLQVEEKGWSRCYMTVMKLGRAS
jgi:hypothetical protein